MNCLCGCGGIVKIGNKFINGHNNRGQKASIETRTKLSKSKKGCTPWNKGKVDVQIYSIETRKKMSLSRIGKESPNKGKVNWFKHTKETKQKIANYWKDPEYRNNLSGINHYSYDPNRNYEYCQIFSDNEFKNSIKERDNYKCSNKDCWETTKTLCIHHIDYDKKNCHPDNLICVCISCNVRANSNKSYWEKYYKSLIRKK